MAEEATAATAAAGDLDIVNANASGARRTSYSRWTWRSLFTWTRPTSTSHGAESEQNLLEMYGGLPISFDSSRVQSKLVYLTPKGSSEGSPTAKNERFINTLIVDQRNVAESAEPRKNVVICHGFGAGLGFFYRNLNPLSQMIPNSRIFAIDLLGMGRSGRPPFPKFQLNVTQDAKEAVNFFLESIEEWRERQDGLEKFTLIGHSMGGYLSALYALRYPHRVEKLILVSPVGLPEQASDGVSVTGHRMPGWITSLWNANYTPQGLVRSLGPLGPRFAQGYVNNRFPYLPEAERLALGSYFYHISADSGSGEYALAALLCPGAWAREPLHSRLPLLSMPTTFVYGANDWMDKAHAESAAADMTVPVRIISVPDSGHHLHLDNPDDFNKILTEEALGAAPS